MAQERTTRLQAPGDEFGEYVAARWPRLVRAAVLLGCTPHEAEDVTGAWECRSCLRVFKVTMIGQLNRPGGVS